MTKEKDPVPLSLNSNHECYFTEDQELAKKFLELAGQYSKRCNMYRAVKVQ